MAVLHIFPAREARRGKKIWFYVFWCPKIEEINMLVEEINGRFRFFEKKDISKMEEINGCFTILPGSLRKKYGHGRDKADHLSVPVLYRLTTILFMTPLQNRLRSQE